MTSEDPIAVAPEPATPHRSGVALYVFGVVLVAVVGFVAVRAVQGRGESVSAEATQRQRDVTAGPRVIVGRVQALPPGRRVTLPGEVRPWRQATIFAKVSGYVRRMLVDKGDTVREGQLLA